MFELDLPLIWGGLIAVSILIYVVLDGFDLGIGILFPFTRSRAERDTMINSVAPVWDGNETWLVMGGGGMLAAFPLAYATLFPALYAPLMVMLLALVFRGVAFEFRFKSANNKAFWDIAFSLGSIIATFCQGVALGAFIQGIKIEGRDYAGGWFDWLTPFSLFTGAALVAGYALLGACWLIMKTDSSLQNLMRRAAFFSGIIVLFFVAVVSIWTPLVSPEIAAKWLSVPSIYYFSIVPCLAWVAVIGLFWSLHREYEAWPFIYALTFFSLSFIGLALSVYPYIVPHVFTIWDAAAPDESLGFLLVGTVVLLPMILGYTAYSYWIFRGKVADADGYHEHH